MGVLLRERAEEVAETLVDRFPQVSGVCLYGSVARGEESPDSDLDLLVVGEDPGLRPSVMRRAVGGHRGSNRISIIYHTRETLQSYLESGARFLLHIQLEGEVLFDASGLLEELKALPPIHGPIAAEVEGQLRRLALYEHPGRYNGNFLFPLSHIYAIGKAIVMAVLSEQEIREFDRERAFDAFAVRFPDSRADIDTVRQLRPFYSVVSKGNRADLPFSSHECAEEVAAAVEAVHRLAANASRT